MFAKLEAHLARLAGSHSGVERTLFDDQGADAATHMHELIHDRCREPSWRENMELRSKKAV